MVGLLHGWWETIFVVGFCYMKFKNINLETQTS